MEEDNEDDEKKSPIVEHVKKELHKIKNQKSKETSILDFNDNEAIKRTHYDDDSNYLGIGPSYRNPDPDDKFFKKVQENAKISKSKSTDSIFIYKISIGYSNPTQIDQIKKALFENTTVLLEGTREPTQDLTKLLKFLHDAHPIVKKKHATYEERQSNAIKEMIAANFPCLVYKLKIECHDIDQIKKLEEALLDTSVIVFSCVNPSHKKIEALEPTIKMQVKQRIKNIFNLGPLN